MSRVKFATNRLDLGGAVKFANSAQRAERLGWHMGLIPCNPLKTVDPYVSLALAAQKTTTLQLGTLLDTPILRHPSVLAGSISTVAELAPERTHLGLGIGDTAVRFNGISPATVNELKEALVMTRDLLHGAKLEVGALKPARLTHAKKVPVWVAAQGPRALAMAGQYADGVWIRVGRNKENLQLAWEAVCAGAKQAARRPQDIKLGLILHTAYSENEENARLMAKAVAAGYYEYSPHLFSNIGSRWDGPPAVELQPQVYPDFHHHRDMVHAGQVVSFLDDKVADEFALYGSWVQIQEQLQSVLDMGLPVSYVVPHPILEQNMEYDFLSLAATHLINQFG